MLDTLANLLRSLQGFYIKAESDLEKSRRDVLELVYKVTELELKDILRELKSGQIE